MLKVKKILAITIACTLGLSAVGCGKDGKAGSDKEESKITISGSTSVGAVMEPLVEEYTKANNGVNIQVQQVGSSAGIKDAIEGIAEIGMSSRDLKDKEKEAGLNQDEIALDAIAVVTNNKNKVNNLTMKQLKEIYTRKINNWKEVGGEDASIVVVSREDGSGTREGFESILGYKSEELAADALISDGSGNIKTTVAGSANAIGYISLGYVDKDVKMLKIDGVEPTRETVKSKKYPITRGFLALYKKDRLGSGGQKFMDYIMSEEGQKIVVKSGFVDVK
ncbi:MAG: phosphate ABC transporter substrate-binding protein [Clostridioides sp.]|jgi:phosphate transport system substrate-binding protein|nr:phosphate ABC transporter substrate-binding protein [Clostridioides sp.]